MLEPFPLVPSSFSRPIPSAIVSMPAGAVNRTGRNPPHQRLDTSHGCPSQRPDRNHSGSARSAPYAADAVRFPIVDFDQRIGLADRSSDVRLCVSARHSIMRHCPCGPSILDCSADLRRPPHAAYRPMDVLGIHVCSARTHGNGLRGRGGGSTDMGGGANAAHV